MKIFGRIAVAGATALALAACGTHRESPAQHAANLGQPAVGLSSTPTVYDSTGATLSSRSYPSYPAYPTYPAYRAYPPYPSNYYPANAYPPLSLQDQEFLQRALVDGDTEIELGQLAYSRAGSSAVRDFARQMVNDHSALAQRLDDIAMRRGLTPVAIPAPIPNELANRSGDDFDQAYMEHMVRDHENALDLFEREAATGADPELRAVAETSLPTLAAHRDMAVRIADEID